MGNTIAKLNLDSNTENIDIDITSQIFSEINRDGKASFRISPVSGNWIQYSAREYGDATMRPRLIINCPPILSMIWKNVEAGEYKLTVKAIYKNKTTTSPPVNIIVLH